MQKPWNPPNDVFFLSHVEDLFWQKSWGAMDESKIEGSLSVFICVYCQHCSDIKLVENQQEATHYGRLQVLQKKY